jgi:ABC-type lipoprotein export system ATPase subunit
MTLSAQCLTKRYGAASGYAAVRGANLVLRRGEFISIVGRSGSGKSTLMAMLGALTKPTEGRLLLDGSDVWTLSETERAIFRARQAGFLFQFPSLLANLTAADNVAVPALLGRSMAAEDAYARAHELLARVGLADRANAYPGSMSGGEQRRVAVARALINAPPLLLADEPTSDLDAANRERMVAALRAEALRGAIVVMATHDPEAAEQTDGELHLDEGVATWPRPLP